jgi:deazaflavin-dependent oxidoreductase (nitroreductase family)
LQRCLTDTHRFWYRLTDGRIGSRFGHLDVLLLTTTGRKSGRPWTTPLTYLQDGDDLVVIASNGGAARHPAWYLNLEASPAATLELPGRTVGAKARTADADEKARLWPQIVEMYSSYADYQRRTSRDIPVVLLRPDA